MDAQTTACPECNGAGGWFEDVWRMGMHATVDSVCERCEGNGEVEARCDCGGPAEVAVVDAPGGWMCRPCKAEAEAWDAEIAS